MSNRQSSRWLVVVVASLLLTSCSSTKSGSPAREHVVVNGVDRGSLDTGQFATEPSPPSGRAGTSHAGQLLEARRLASNVVPPFEVDPSLSESLTTAETMPLASSDALVDVLPRPIQEGAADHHFVAGFSSARRGTTKSLINVVLRFNTQADASSAVTDMSAKSSNIETAYSDPKPTRPVSIPRYPETSAAAFNAVATVNVFAYTARGPYVLCQYTTSSEGADSAANLVSETLDKQLPLIDSFSATPVEKLPELEVDPTGLWALTLSPLDPPLVTLGMYDARAALHFQDDPARSQQTFNSVGLQAVAMGRDTVYRVADAAAAKHMADDFASEVQGRNAPAPGVRGLPSARCFEPRPDSLAEFYCVGSVNQFVIEASDNATAARQMFAAQYLILASR